MTCKNQVPDSFPFVLEREFGNEAASNYETYIQNQQLNGLKQSYSSNIDQLSAAMNFATGVDYMNQVLCYDRLQFFGNLQE
jgi:hypothetical protein